MGVEIVPLSKFFAEHGPAPKEEFLSLFGGGFLLLRVTGMTPGSVFLPRQEGFSIAIGSDEDCDLAFEEDQTMDSKHATVAYHKGFRGWTIEDHETSFGTHAGEERLQKGRPHLMQDREAIKVGGGYVQMQFYLAETLWKRMHTAGITKSLRNKANKGAKIEEAVEQPPEEE